MVQRYLPNHPSMLLKEERPHEQLVNSLESIVRACPPQDTYSRHDLHGLYSGPTSIAYLFLRLAQIYPNLVVDGHDASSWCRAYLLPSSRDHGRQPVEVTVDKCGVINEELAACAILAAMTGDEEYCSILVHHTATVVQPCGSDEWLYGRAGFLYLLRMVRQWTPSSGTKETMQACIKKVGDRILQDGPPWRWHGKEYLGAVHGSVGIITQLVLCNPDYAAHPKVTAALNDLLRSQDSAGGNFPSSVESGRDSLVQFCHGAPGFVLSLPLIQKYFDAATQVTIDDCVAQARNCIWERGLLTKEPNLCHGATANALALTSPQREHLMAYTTTKMVAKGIEEGWYIEGSDPYGLFCGEAGRAWGWAVIVAGKDLGIIGYSDV
ncbi:MAG: hypothetical protein LQ349_005672 [Xanthoria aureola]|nr:MAG: hypothetical protein LQ349_005672 [Xanthoria aureola]